MTFRDFLTSEAQPAYSANVALIADFWSSVLGPDFLATLDNANLYPRMVELLEGGGLDDGLKLEIAANLTSLSWWRGPMISDEMRARADAVSRSILTGIADTLDMSPRALPAARLRRAHVIFAGVLQDPSHSPSAAAIDYAAALALDKKVDRLEIVHSGEILPAMSAYIEDRLGSHPHSRGIALVSTVENADFLAGIVARGPCTFHIVCEPALSPVISILNRLGPTVMFTCADSAPVQYADVYWFYHSAEYMERLWSRQGAPEVLTGNYVQSLSGPWRPTPAPEPMDRTALGLSEDHFVIATVGNRLGIELDETYITGMELAVRDRPKAVWMVVGGLPENLVDACQQVLGPKFLHIPFSPILGRLMTVVDVFANPFRVGGGRSGYLALEAGAAVLTLGQGDVATAIPEDVRAQDPEDYFRRLELLIDEPDLLRAYKAYQAQYFSIVCDQNVFLGNLQNMIRLAADRYAARGCGAPLSSTVFTPEIRLAKAG